VARKARRRSHRPSAARRAEPKVMAVLPRTARLPAFHRINWKMASASDPFCARIRHPSRYSRAWSTCIFVALIFSRSFANAIMPC